MNLLPDSYKKELAYEAWRRFLEFVSIYALIIGLIANALLLPSYFFLSYQLDVLQDRANILSKSKEFSQAREGEAEIEKANQLVGKVVNFDTDVSHRAPIVEDIINRTSNSISLGQLSLERRADGVSAVHIDGVALTRADLLAFKAALEQSQFVKNVNSPLTNYLKDENSPFSVTVDLKKESL